VAPVELWLCCFVGAARPSRLFELDRGQVWEKYAQTAKLMLKEGVDAEGRPLGKLLCSTVRENQAMMKAREAISTPLNAPQPSVLCSSQ